MRFLHFSRIYFVTLMALLAMFNASPACAQSLSKLRVIPLNIGLYVIQAEVATTPAQREQGLMFREKMGANEGMAFIFDAPSSTCMWMKNTLIPLSVAFIDGEGKIINIEDMTPQSTDSHCAKGLAKYALEMNQGWFQRKNIKPGTPIEGLPR